jgi:hypothetical protein
MVSGRAIQGAAIFIHGGSLSKPSGRAAPEQRHLVDKAQIELHQERLKEFSLIRPIPPHIPA